MSIAAIFIFLVAAIFIFQKYSTKSLGDGEIVNGEEFLPLSGNDFNSVKFYELPDFTKIWTDAGTKVSVSDRFKSGRRLVSLEGNAFFEVAKDKNHPFVIEIREFNVKVLGTSFQIYSDDSGIEVNVYSGVVELLSKDLDKIILEKGEGATFDKNKGKFVKIKQEAFKLNSRDSYLIFNNTSLKDVFSRLSNYFNVKIHFDCKSIDILGGFTSPQFAGDSIEDYFSTIEKVYDLSFQKLENGEYKIKCD